MVQPLLVVPIGVCVCVCVCKVKRERSRERGQEREREDHSPAYTPSTVLCSNTHHTTSTAGGAGAGAGAGAGSGADSASASASNSSRWNQSPRAAPRSIHAPARYTPHHVPTVQQLQAADEAKLAAARSRAARLKRLARVHIPYVPPEPIHQRTAQPATASHTTSSGSATGAVAGAQWQSNGGRGVGVIPIPKKSAEAICWVILCCCAPHLRRPH